MAKYVKFAIADSGVLVYRSTGKMFRGDYSTRTSSNGIITVYNANGRKIGTVGKPTKAERQRIDEIDKRNRKSRQKAYQRKIVKRGQIDWRLAEKTGTWKDYAIAQESTALIPRKSWKQYEISFTEQSIMNYARALSEGVRSGLMSDDEASQLFELYKADAKDRSKRDSLGRFWNALNKRFDEIGFKYTVEVAEKNNSPVSDSDYEKILLGKK